MTALIDSRPARVDQLFRPGNTATITALWPAGYLAGRSFTSTLDAATLAVSIVGDTMTISATEAQTTTAGQGVHTWLLTETTGGASNDLMAGVWTGDPNAADTQTSTTVSVTVGGATVAVTLAGTGVSSVNGAAGAVQLDADRLVTWHDGWSRWDAVQVTNPDHSTHVLTTDDGVGVISGGAPSAGGNDRVLYLLDDPVDVADIEVYLDWETSSGDAQGGIALRADNDTAIMVWSNVILGANGNCILGIWEFNGTTSLTTNQQPTSLDGFKSSVASASGNGTTVTVRTVLPHELTAGQILELDASFGGFGQVTVASVLDDTTWTFTSATAGSWTGGTYRWVFAPGRVKCGVRLQGNVITFKRWLPEQDEPAWDDPLKSATATLPATLASGAPLPTRGRIGLLGSHLNLTRNVRVNDFRFRVLDGVEDRRVHSDTATHAEAGLLTARLDALDGPGQQSPRDHGLICWTFDPLHIIGGQAISNGDVRIARLPVRDEDVVDTIYWAVATSDSDPIAGQCQIALYSPAGTRLHAAADIASAVTSAGVKATTIAATQVVPPFVWVAIVVNFTTGGTFAVGRASAAIPNGAHNVGLATSALRFAQAATGQTSLPATINPSTLVASGAAFPWAGLGT